MTGSLSLAEAPDPPSNPPTIIYYLDPQNGISSQFSLCRERLRESNTRTPVTQRMGTKQCLSKVPFPFTPVTSLPSQFYSFNFYLDEASPPGRAERAFRDKHCFRALPSAHENTVAQRRWGTCPKSPSTDQARHTPQAGEAKCLISWVSRTEKLMISRFPSSTRSVQSKSLPSHLPP